MSTEQADGELTRLRRRNAKLSSLLDVATAMTRERQLDGLLDLVLSESVKTVDADRGSIFIVDRAREALLSRLAQGESRTIRVPIDSGIAGAVARSGRPLSIPDAYADPRFNPEVDRETGYRTRSILCVPMLGSRGEVVGVVQALNRRDGPFTAEDEELLMALGASAAAAIENANLYEEIERLFEGFVQASVMAIESRDPTTAGHSSRVAELSVTLLECLERSGGPYRGVTFGAAEVRELRYAALLHDFGKVGVREHVLLKADKLYPHQLERLEQRFELARRAAEVEALEAELALWRSDPEAARLAGPGLRARATARAGELDDLLALIRRCNRPSVLEAGGPARLAELTRLTFRDARGDEQVLLHAHEFDALSIPRGSLTAEERREIESHVTHTFRFLNAIPWTRDLARVPLFAHGHHERLDGGGYPRGAPARELPLQTRVMTIADIYDALTAADRPYKKAMPREQALDILSAEARAGHVDRELLEVFVEARVPERARGG